LQRKFRFDVLFNPCWPKWHTNHSKLVDKDFETSEFYQDMWNRYLMLGFVSAHIPWNLYQIISYHSHVRHYSMTLLYCPLQPIVTFARGNMHCLWMQLRSNCQYEIKLV
jgi:hypothetical protein